MPGWSLQLQGPAAPFFCRRPAQHPPQRPAGRCCSGHCQGSGPACGPGPWRSTPTGLCWACVTGGEKPDLKVRHWNVLHAFAVTTGCPASSTGLGQAAGFRETALNTAWHAMRARSVMLACMDSRPCLPVRSLASSATAETSAWNSALAFAASSTALLNQCRRLSCCLWPAAHRSAGACTACLGSADGVRSVYSWPSRTRVHSPTASLELLL